MMATHIMLYLGLVTIKAVQALSLPTFPGIVLLLYFNLQLRLLGVLYSNSFSALPKHNQGYAYP